MRCSGGGYGEHVANTMLLSSSASRFIRNLHYKASHYLLQNYCKIIFPKFNAHDIAKYSKLGRKNKRRLDTVGFHKFRQRLLQTATLYRDSQVCTGSEAYTSKQCGFIHDELGCSEIFTCPSCKLVADRDMHAARNILLKFLELSRGA